MWLLHCEDILVDASHNFKLLVCYSFSPSLFADAQISLTATKQRLDEVNSSSVQLSKYQYEFHQMEQRLTQWKEAAAVISVDLSGVEPTPGRLGSYLANIENYRQQYRREVQVLVSMKGLRVFRV